MNPTLKKLILKFTGTQAMVDSYQHHAVQRKDLINFFANASTFCLMAVATVIGFPVNIEQKMKSDAWYMLTYFAVMWHSLIAFFIVADHGKNRSSMESLSKATITATTAAAAITLATSETNSACNNRGLFTGLVTAPLLTMAYSIQTEDSTNIVLADVAAHTLEAVMARELIDSFYPQNTCKP